MTQFCIEEAAGIAAVIVDNEAQADADSQTRGESEATRNHREIWEKFGGARAAG